MYSKKAEFKSPLAIDVAKLASYFPEFRYGPLHSFIGKPITSEYILNDAGGKKFQVLLFDDKSTMGFNSVISAYTSKELAYLFSRLPEELSFPLIQALKGTPLEIPSLSENEKQKFSQVYELQKNRDIKLALLQGQLRNIQAVDFDSSQALTILQHEYGITDANSEQPVLGTFGARPCLIVGLYDQKNKKAILAHIDALTSIHQSMSHLLGLVSPQHTVAHLAGGNMSTKEMCLNIVDILEKNNIKIENSDIVKSSGYSASLAIDARNGKIYSPVSPEHLSYAPDIDLRLQITGLQFMESPLIHIHVEPRKNPTSSPRDEVKKINHSPIMTQGFLARKKGAKFNQQIELKKFTDIVFCGDNLYDILNVACHATQQEIREAYKLQAFKYHPDRNRSQDAASKFNKVKYAYDILSNPASRAAYDCNSVVIDEQHRRNLFLSNHHHNTLLFLPFLLLAVLASSYTTQFQYISEVQLVDHWSILQKFITMSAISFNTDDFFISSLAHEMREDMIPIVDSPWFRRHRYELDGPMLNAIDNDLSFVHDDLANNIELNSNPLSKSTR